MGERSAGRHAFDAAAVTNVEQTPQLEEGRREVRNGGLILGGSSAALIFGLLAAVLNLTPPHSALHPLVTLATGSGGVFAVHGVRTVRNGRATLRDEIRRQTEGAEAGKATED